MMNMKLKTNILILAVILPIIILGYSLSRLERAWNFIGAAQRGDLLTLSRNLEEGVDPNVVSYPSHITALRMAIENHQKEAVKLLLNKGANPNDGLYLAVDMDQVDMTELLLIKGGDINIENDGQSLLDVAKQKGDKKMVQLLKSKGIKTNNQAEQQAGPT